MCLRIFSQFQSTVSPSGHLTACSSGMATTLPLAPSGNEPQNASAEGSPHATDQAMVPSLQMPEFESSMMLNGPVARLPVELDVSVPVRNFRVRNLLTLEPAQLIESGWGHGEDVPLAAGHVQLAWSEFEVVDTQLAVRITRLA